MSTRRTDSVNKLKVAILISSVLLIFLAFATVWSEIHKKTEPQATQQTTSADESTSAGDSSVTTDANASEPATDNISINEMQAKIDELQQQIADKDMTIAELQQQVTDLQNGAEKNGGVTFQEFLKLYFWSDGHVYQMAEDKKLYNNYACTDEYAVNVADYTFPCNRTLQMTLDNGLTIHMLMTTDGQILWTPSPWLNQVQ